MTRVPQVTSRMMLRARRDSNPNLLIRSKKATTTRPTPQFEAFRSRDYVGLLLSATKAPRSSADVRMWPVVMRGRSRLVRGQPDPR